MILYNVTINIDATIQKEWLIWMKEIHIPKVMETGCFTENKVCRILAEEDSQLKAKAIKGNIANIDKSSVHSDEVDSAIDDDLAIKPGEASLAVSCLPWIVTVLIAPIVSPTLNTI